MSAARDDRASARARELFIEALLEERYRSRRADVERVVTRALARIEPRGARGAWRRWPLAAGFAAALALLWLGPGPPPASARALVDRALFAARDPLDRRYVVRIESARGERATQVELDVRGASAFSGLVVDGLLAGTRFGWDGTEVWLVPARPRLPALSFPEPPRLAEWLDERDLDLPFLQLTAALELLGEGYDLELVDARATGLNTVRARRRASVSLAPACLELDVRPADGVLCALRAEWARPLAGPRRVELALAAETNLDARWYERMSHCAPERPVRRFDAR